MAGAQHRRAETDGRAERGTGGRTLRPEEIAAAFNRIANDLSLLAQRPEEPETQSPSLEDPWDADAADELARLYASGDAGLAQPLSGDAELQLRLARTVAQAAALRAPVQTSGIDHARIEVRLAEMTRMIEASLARLGAASAASAGVTAPMDAGGLKLVEAHAAELLAQAQETRAELGRLVAVEAQLDELKASLSEDRIAGLIEAVMPTEDELTRFAEAAAQKAVRGRREATTDLAATARLNERASEIQRLLAGFIDEHRQSEHQVAEALETMQQAMQHILDRIDAIEAAQGAAIEALPENPQTRDGLGHAAREAAVGSVEDARARAGFASPAWGDLGFGDHGIEADSFEASATGDRDAATARLAAYEEDIKPFPTLRTRTTGAASEYDGRPPVRPGILVAASLAAFLLAGYWLVSGPRLRLPDGVSAQSAEQQHPGETSPSVPPPLRSSSARPDMDSGRAGRRAKAAGGPDQAIEHTAPGWRTERGSEPPETQALRVEKGTAADAPAEPDQWTAPARRDTLQGPLGVVIEQGATAMSPEELLRLRQRQRIATLSTQLGQQAAVSTEQPVAVSAGAAAAGRQDRFRTGEATQPRVSVELPPLMVGPHSLRHAAANGDAAAQFEVAARLAEGKGVKQDFEQAAIWYQRAATQGLAAAQYRLAALYERGVGVKADQARAKAWYKRAADQGNLKAMHNLAVLSAGSGEGSTPDYAAAGRWFAEAAARGLADSQYNLGVLHENGLGVAKDYAAAYKWYALAARGGDKEALRRRELVKERLSPVAIRSADVEIATWRALPVDQLANDARTAGGAWKGRAARSAD